jgi:O-antigen ligase
LVFTGFVLFAWLLILLVHHGVRQQSIGGINRNMVATAALVAMIGTLFAHQKFVRWTGMALALFFLVVVASRGSLLVLVVFLTVYYALHEGSTKAAIVGVLMVGVGALVLLVSSSASDAFLEKLLHLHSQDRGIGSGFTGRLDNWRIGIEHLGRRLAFGHGFRVTASPASGIPLIHSGYINLLLETGVVGTLLILGTMFTAIIQRTLLIFRIQKSIGSVNLRTSPWADTIQLNVIAVGVFSLSLVIWVYEPVYINLGSVLSLLLFMMLVAPMYAPATPINHKR